MTLAVGVLACGKRGDPLPPLPKTPQAVSALRVAQRGAELEVSFLAPRLTTGGARLPVLDVEVLRADGEGDFEKVATRVRHKTAPGERLVLREPLPPPGTPVRVGARAWHGREGSALGPVVAMRVQAPPAAPEGFTASLQKQGVLLRFSLPQALLSPPPSPPPSPAPTAPNPAPSSASATPPPQSPSPGVVIYRRDPKGDYGFPVSGDTVTTPFFEDRTVAAGEAWCYVARTAISRDPLVESGNSAEACVTVKDVFAPEPPTGVSLLVLPDAVEVSWSPSPEGDLARYHVYRALGGTEPQLLGELSAEERILRDTDLIHGQPYTYRVTAVDRDGNESEPSAPVECRLP